MVIFVLYFDFHLHMQGLYRAGVLSLDLFLSVPISFSKTTPFWRRTLCLYHHIIASSEIRYSFILITQM